MANATATNCTLVNTALVVGAVTAGTLVAGMTITAPGVPAGVTIVSQSTGPAGGAGTYVATASSANVTTPETMTFSLSWIMPLVGNSSAPQVVDMRLAAGVALFVAAAIPNPTAGPGAEYTHGTHAEILYNTQAAQSSQIFRSAFTKQANRVFGFSATLPQYVDPPQPVVIHAQESVGEVKNQPFPFVSGAPQQIDVTPWQQPFIDAPVVVESGSNLGAEYHFGTHQAQLVDSQNHSVVFQAVPTPIVPGQQVPLRTIHIQPQEIYQDLLTPREWLSTIPLNQGWIMTFCGASPQAFDFTLQATFISASPFTLPQVPIRPKTLIGVRQEDPTQIQPAVFTPTAKAVAPQKQPFVVGAPDRQDYTQPQPSIQPAVIAGASKFPMRPTIIVPQQSYVDIFPTPFTRPVIGILIPPPPPPPPPYTCTPLWDFSGKWNWSFDGYPGWSFDGYEPTPLQCAVQGLAAFGVNVGQLTYVCSNTVPTGWVITGWVPYANVAYAGQYIPLTISNGPCILPTPITVPNVVGMFYYDAQLAILDAGFDIAYPTWALSTTVLPQYVISQSIPAGTVFSQQTTISIVVSGFPVVNQPNTVVPVP